MVRGRSGEERNDNGIGEKIHRGVGGKRKCENRNSIGRREQNGQGKRDKTKGKKRARDHTVVRVTLEAPTLNREGHPIGGSPCVNEVSD